MFLSTCSCDDIILIDAAKFVCILIRHKEGQEKYQESHDHADQPTDPCSHSYRKHDGLTWCDKHEALPQTFFRKTNYY